MKERRGINMKTIILCTIGVTAYVILASLVVGVITNYGKTIIRAIFSKHHECQEEFILFSDMWNVDVLYDEIRNREFLLPASKLRYTVVYKNDKLGIILKFTNLSTDDYYQAILRIYMLQIEGLCLPDDVPRYVHTVKVVPDIEELIGLYNDLYLHLKYSDYNETQLIMIKSCSPESDDISYKVCVGKTNALDYIKLMQNTLRIQYNLDSINEDNTEDSDEIDDKGCTRNIQFDSDNFPVLDTFEIIGGNTDELYEFLEYFVEGNQAPYSINSVYGDKDVVYYSSSYEYLGTLLSDIRDSIKLNTEKKQTVPVYKVISIVTAVFDGTDNDPTIDDIDKMVQDVEPEYICIVRMDLGSIVFTDSTQYMMKYIKSRDKMNRQ